MNKLIKLIVLSTVCLGLLVGCTKKKEEQKPIVEETLFNNVKEATFVINHDNEVVKTDNIPEQSKIIEWYSDPFCPSCVAFDDILSERLIEITQDNVVYIRFHLMGFLSPKSLDDYSNRASSLILGSAEFAPTIAVNFMHEIFDKDFHPGLNEETSDDKFKEAFLKVGGNEEQWSKILEHQGELIKQVETATAKAFNDEDLLSKMNNGRLVVPTVILGDSEKALDLTLEKDTERFVMKSIKSYKNKLLGLPDGPTMFSLLGEKDYYLIGDALELGIKLKEETDVQYTVEWKVINQAEEKVETLTTEEMFNYIVLDNDKGIYIKLLNDNSEVVDEMYIEF